MKGLLHLSFLFIISTTVAFSLGQGETARGMTLEDASGFQIVIKSKPQRIISGAQFVDELLYSIADTKNILAITPFSTDKDISNIADWACSQKHRLSFNVKSYIDLKPDLIILAEWSDFSKVQELRDAGIPVYQVNFPTTLEKVQSLILTMGIMLREEEKATGLLTWMDNRLEPLMDKVASIKPADRLTVLDYNPGFGTAFGKNSIWNEIVTLAGLKNIAADYEEDDYGTLSLSRDLIIKLNPDIIVLPGWVYDDPKGPEKIHQRFMADQAFKNLKAVKNNRVYQIPEKYRHGGSHFFVKAVEIMAALAYPDLFIQ
ncbi:MAG: ABC transporter substrate-binding protein [Spirochaetales bacterium]|nr:ABC transporter substrate-binding protein [Spirochaetales bacterium]